MEPEVTMVDETFDGAADDTLLEEPVEELPDESETLGSILGTEEQPAEEPQEEPETPSASEPGWIKKRVEKAVSKAVEQTRKDMLAEFDQRMAPILAKMMESEAQELVASRKVGDIETARELVRLRNGQTAAPRTAQEPAVQPAQANNQPAKQNDPEISVRAKILRGQADKIKAKTGLDVLAEYNSNPELQERVFNGELDFYDVADMMRQQKNKRPPSPTRSPNGASVTNPNSIMNMTDEQFERLEERIKRGARIRLE